MTFKPILNTEIGLLSEAEIAGRGSCFHPPENKARKDVALLQFLHHTAKAAGAIRLFHCLGVVGVYLNLCNSSEYHAASSAFSASTSSSISSIDSTRLASSQFAGSTSRTMVATRWCCSAARSAAEQPRKNAGLRKFASGPKIFRNTAVCHPPARGSSTVDTIYFFWVGVLVTVIVKPVTESSGVSASKSSSRPHCSCGGSLQASRRRARDAQSPRASGARQLGFA